MNLASRHPPLTGRAAAAQAVADALAGRGFAVDGLRALRSAGQLDERDAGFAQELALGTLRRAYTIRCVLRALAPHDDRRFDERLRAVLWTGAYQVIWMDRVPPFAAVDEAVTLARRANGPRAGGLVNAVLRKLTAALAERRTAWQPRDALLVRVDWAHACRFARPVLPPPDELPAHLAAATGERAGRFQTLVKRLGVESAAAVAWASSATPVVVLQCNTLRMALDECAAAARAAFGDGAGSADGTVFLPAGTAFADAPAFRAGLFFAQDTTARAAAAAVAAQPGERVLDLCAAPGGKSLALALQMGDRGEIVACDTDPLRLDRITENVARLQPTCVRPQLIEDSEGPHDDELGQFDAVLVDAPCSNSGVLARRPEARFRLTRAKLAGLADLQARLLVRAERRVRPGGRLVYSTCSIEPEESEAIIRAFVARHIGWTCVSSRTTLPAWGPQASDWRDGGYVACLVSPAG